jgi:hypothetical protein
MQHKFKNFRNLEDFKEETRNCITNTSATYGRTSAFPSHGVYSDIEDLKT